MDNEFHVFPEYTGRAGAVAQRQSDRLACLRHRVQPWHNPNYESLQSWEGHLNHITRGQRSQGMHGNELENYRPGADAELLGRLLIATWSVKCALME